MRHRNDVETSIEFIFGKEYKEKNCRTEEGWFTSKDEPQPEKIHRLYFELLMDIRDQLIKIREIKQ